jgi:hypothetical protein
VKARHATQVLSLAALLAACGAEAKSAEPVAGCPTTSPESAAGQIILPGSGRILALRRAAQPPPGDHLITEFVRSDGSISIKFPWWVDGRLRITGASLDGHPGRVRGEYESVPRDFHPGYLVFPSEGCWRVTGRAGPTRLTFVVEVLDCRRECAAL